MSSHAQRLLMWIFGAIEGTMVGCGLSHRMDFGNWGTNNGYSALIVVGLTLAALTLLFAQVILDSDSF